MKDVSICFHRLYFASAGVFLTINFLCQFFSLIYFGSIWPKKENFVVFPEVKLKWANYQNMYNATQVWDIWILRKICKVRENSINIHGGVIVIREEEKFMHCLKRMKYCTTYVWTVNINALHVCYRYISNCVPFLEDEIAQLMFIPGIAFSGRS